MDELTICFLGTGAADFDWPHFDPATMRGSCSTLIGSRILIDCGPTTLSQLLRFGCDPALVTDLVFTHSHADHFDEETLERLIAARGDAPPLTVHAVAQLLQRIASRRITPHPITKRDTFPVGDLSFTALPANHTVEDLDELCLHYLIETPQGNILYALDGAWYCSEARFLLRDKRVHLLIQDATMQHAGDRRFMEHADAEMVALLKRGLDALGVTDTRTLVVLNHMARTLWPSFDESEAFARRRGWCMARDGLVLTLPTKKE